MIRSFGIETAGDWSSFILSPQTLASPSRPRQNHLLNLKNLRGISVNKTNQEDVLNPPSPSPSQFRGLEKIVR